MPEILFDEAGAIWDSKLEVFGAIILESLPRRRRFSAVLKFVFEEAGTKLNSLGIHFGGEWDDFAKLWFSSLLPQKRIFKRTWGRLKRPVVESRTNSGTNAPDEADAPDEPERGHHRQGEP